MRFRSIHGVARVGFVYYPRCSKGGGTAARGQGAEGTTAGLGSPLPASRGTGYDDSESAYACMTAILSYVSTVNAVPLFERQCYVMDTLGGCVCYGFATLDP